jgi:hypothetical protein
MEEEHICNNKCCENTIYKIDEHLSDSIKYDIKKKHLYDILKKHNLSDNKIKLISDEFFNNLTDSS